MSNEQKKRCLFWFYFSTDAYFITYELYVS